MTSDQDWIQKETERLVTDRREIPLKYLEYGVDFYRETIGFNYHFVVFIGVIAGFGFTSFDVVQSKLLFIVSELSFSLIAAFVLLRTRKIYKGESDSILNSHGKRMDFFKKWKGYLELGKKNEITESAYRRLMSDVAEEVFGKKEEFKLDPLPPVCIVLFFVSVLILLLSFFSIDVSNWLIVKLL